MNYALVGYGRMGRAIETAARLRGHRCVATIDSPERAIDASTLSGAEVAFEFTRPEAAERNVLDLLAAGVGVVCGTTGWDPQRIVAQAAADAAGGLIVAPNFSLGVNLFFRIARQAARMVAAAGTHQAFVTEAHHRGKLDAPSGTARELAGIVIDEDPRLSGMLVGNPDGAMPHDRLQVVSVRAGAEPGTHTVGFDGEHDRISIRHAARSRAGFAAGAVLAAEWIRNRCGLHDFDAVVDELLQGAPGDRANQA